MREEVPSTHLIRLLLLNLLLLLLGSRGGATGGSGASSSRASGGHGSELLLARSDHLRHILAGELRQQLLDALRLSLDADCTAAGNQSATVIIHAPWARDLFNMWISPALRIFLISASEGLALPPRTAYRERRRAQNWRRNI